MERETIDRGRVHIQFKVWWIFSVETQYSHILHQHTQYNDINFQSQGINTRNRIFSSLNDTGNPLQKKVTHLAQHFWTPAQNIAFIESTATQHPKTQSTLN